MRTKFRLFQNFGLKQKALLIFLLLVIFPTLAVGIVVQFKYKAILHDQFVNSTIRNLDAVVNQLEEQTSMVEDIANYMIFNPNLSAYLHPDAAQYSDTTTDSLKESVEGLLIFHLFSKPYIHSISIDGFNGNHIAMGEPASGDESKWLGKAVPRKGGIVWSEGYTVDSGWSGQVKVVSMFRILRTYKNITAPLGSLVIRLDEASIVSLLENELYKESGNVFVIGPDGEDILQSEVTLPTHFDKNEVLAKMTAQDVRFMNYKAGSERFLTFSRTMESTSWHIITAIPESVVNQQSLGVRLFMNVILVAILLLGATALIGFHYTIIRPILRLKNETTRVKLGDFSARVPISSNDEISDLNRKFNEMVLTIQELIDHKYKLEIRERESELKLLQSQMDPHFLYNTLDMIRWTARLEKAEKASQLIEVLSRFFRSGLNNGQYVTTLLQELQFVQSYLYLHQRRLGSNKLQYALYTEYNIGDAQIPKTTIQPLVENFLKYGLNTKASNNLITVRCFTVRDEIWIEVQDNGMGIAPHQLQLIQASLHGKPLHDSRTGALHNIHERLSIFFGERYGLEIVSSSSNGTWVRLKIPYTKKIGGENDV
ncbi:sensor histidine kinase [Paenibacillaceae bacterium]|nr:sensor histidine kinase [Paenibacillaceae bacterium]